MILLLSGTGLVDLVELHTGKRIYHVDLFLLDATNPLAVINDGVILSSFFHTSGFPKIVYRSINYVMSLNLIIIGGHNLVKKQLSHYVV